MATSWLVEDYPVRWGVGGVRRDGRLAWGQDSGGRVLVTCAESPPEILSDVSLHVDVPSASGVRRFELAGTVVYRESEGEQALFVVRLGSRSASMPGSAAVPSTPRART